MKPGIFDLLDIGGNVYQGVIDIVSWYLFEEELDLDAIWELAQRYRASIMEALLLCPQI